MEFSIGLQAAPESWDSKSQKLRTKDINSDVVNNNLDLVTQKVRQAYLKLLVADKTFTVRDILDQYFGKAVKKRDNLLNYYSRYLENLEQLVDIDLKRATYQKYVYVQSHLADFIRFKYKVSDIPPRDLKLIFHEHFEFYLKTKKKLGQSTINKIIQRLRRLIKLALSEGFIDRDPFLMYKVKGFKKEIVFLNTGELQQLEDYLFRQN